MMFWVSIRAKMIDMAGLRAYNWERFPNLRKAAQMTYRTKQKEMLLEYLRSAEGEHVTAGDVCEYFKSKGLPIGQSTVYRRLESLVDEGIIKKYTIDNQASACFEYIGDECHHEGNCYHLKCENCGKLFHLHCDEIDMLQDHIGKEHEFTLDPVRTVFYGTCKDCSKGD